MALSNYTELQDSIGKWLNRGDLADQIPEFITLTEAEISRVLRKSSTRQTVVISEEALTLGPTVGELRSVRLVTASPYRDLPLEIGTPEIFWGWKASFAASGRPRKAALIAGRLVVAPVPDAAYSAEIVFYNALVPLSASNPTNEVLRDDPDVYLFGSLMQAAPFLKDDERIPVWEAKFQRGLDQIEVHGQRKESASLQPIRLPVILGDRV